MIISNVKIITWDITNQILEGHSVRIYQDLITDIDQDHLIKDKYPEDEILDGNGQFLMPGLICAHTHFYGTFSRGLYIPVKPLLIFHKF
jgi:cytosine/adenosine deaminase-related metal-dependent hydrolase